MAAATLLDTRPRGRGGDRLGAGRPKGQRQPLDEQTIERAVEVYRTIRRRGARHTAAIRKAAAECGLSGTQMRKALEAQWAEDSAEYRAAEVQRQAATLAGVGQQTAEVQPTPAEIEAQEEHQRRVERARYKIDHLNSDARQRGEALLQAEQARIAEMEAAAQRVRDHAKEYAGGANAPDGWLSGITFRREAMRLPKLVAHGRGQALVGAAECGGMSDAAIGLAGGLKDLSLVAAVRRTDHAQHDAAERQGQRREGRSR